MGKSLSHRLWDRTGPPPHRLLARPPAIVGDACGDDIVWPRALAPRLMFNCRGRDLPLCPRAFKVPTTLNRRARPA